VLAHYNDVIRRRREMYKTQLMSIRLGEKDSLRVECDGQLSQLITHLDNHQLQIDEQLKRRGSNALDILFFCQFSYKYIMWHVA